MKVKLVVLSCFLLLAVGALVVTSHLSESSSESNTIEVAISKKDFLLMTLESELEQINAQLPKNLDLNTVLNSISIDGDTVINNHSINNVAESSLSVDTITTTLIPKILARVCSDESQRTLLSNNIGIKMKYFDNEGELVFDFMITDRECI